MFLSPPSISSIKRFLNIVADSEAKNPLVIVPGGALRAEVESLLMAEGGGFGGVEVATLTGFACLVSGLEPSSQQLFSALLHSLLSVHGSNLSEAFGANVGSLHRLFDIFRQAGIPGDEIGRFLQENCSESPLVRQVADLYRRYCVEIAGQGLVDGAVIFETASRALDLFPLRYSRLLMLGFYSLTPCQGEFLDKLSSSVVNGCERLVEVSPEAFKVELPEDLLKAAFLSPMTAQLFSGIDVNKITVNGYDDCKRAALSFRKCPTPTKEVTSAVEWANEQIDKGVAPGDIAILFAGFEHYASTVTDFLVRLGVPFTLLEESGVQPEPHWQLLKNVISLLVGNCDPALLLRLLSSPCIYPQEGCREVWRLLLVGSRLRMTGKPFPEWSQLVSAYFGKLSKGKDGRVEILHKRFDEELVRKSGDELLAVLRAISDLSNTGESDFNARLLALFNLPAFERSREELRSAVMRLGEETAEVLGRGWVISPAEAAMSALEQLASPRGGMPNPNAVAVGPLFLGRHLLRGRLYIGGLTDDAFPFRRDFLPFFPELAASRQLAVIDRAFESRYIYYLLTRRASEVTLSYPVQRGFRAMSPSFYYYFEIENKSDETEIAGLSELPALTDSFASARLIASEKPLSGEWRDEVRRYLSIWPHHEGGIRGGEVENLRFLCPVTPFSGNLSGDKGQDCVKDELARVFERGISVSHIEKFALCPLRFFFEKVLGLTPDVDEVENLLDPRDRGTLAHKLLSDFYAKWRELRGSVLLSAEPEFAGKIMVQMVNKKAGTLRDSGAPLYLLHWLERMALGGKPAGIASKFIEYEIAEQMPVPEEVEFPVRRDVTVENQRFVLSGTIDRLDKMQDGSLWIVDYKTGTVPSFTELRTGKSLQLPLYAFLIEDKCDVERTLFCHYQLARKFGRSVSKQRPHDALVSESMQKMLKLLPQILSFSIRGVFNRTFDGDEAAKCPFSGVCHRLCDQGYTPTGEPHQFKQQVFSRYEMPEGEEAR